MKRSWIVGAVGLAMLMFVATAGAAVVGKFQRMRFETSNGATLRWVTTANDSPTDANQRALKLVLHPNAPGCSDQNLAACSFGRAFSRASNSKRTPVGDQMNLSWDFAAANPVTASERMNVFFANGDVAFLNSVLCTHAIASSGGTWLRSDFTGFKTNCEIDVVGDTGGTYLAANGTDSAWTVYAKLLPDQVVTIRHLLVDSGAAPRRRGEQVPLRSHLPRSRQDVHQQRDEGGQLPNRERLLVPRGAQATAERREGPRQGPSRCRERCRGVEFRRAPIVYRWSTSSNPNPEG